MNLFGKKKTDESKENFFEAKKKKHEENKAREKVHKEMLKAEKESLKEPKVCPNDDFLVLSNVNKIYDNHVQAVYDFSLSVKENEFIVFVGPSGCGKSTTLRMIAGLEDITSGDLYIGGEYSNYIPPKDRDIAMVFQSYALYPHMNVYENMAFGLKIRRIDKDEIKRRVDEAAEMLQLTECLDRKPKELSGGQCQRVALGRAIVRSSKLFLMDEPLSNLDAKLRSQMRSEIVSLHERLKTTTIYVTHDQTEAMTMADRIVVMNKGYIQQIGAPLDVYNHPANMFVATFIGSPEMNIAKCTVDKGVLNISDEIKIKLPKDKVKAINDFYANSRGKDVPLEAYFGIRPEDIVEGSASAEEDYSKLYETVADISELLGAESYVHFTAGNAKFLSKTSIKNKLVKKGDKYTYRFNIEKIHLFDINTKNTIF